MKKVQWQRKLISWWLFNWFNYTFKVLMTDRQQTLLVVTLLLGLQTIIIPVTMADTSSWPVVVSAPLHKTGTHKRNNWPGSDIFPVWHEMIVIVSVSSWSISVDTSWVNCICHFERGHVDISRVSQTHHHHCTVARALNSKLVSVLSLSYEPII